MPESAYDAMLEALEPFALPEQWYAASFDQQIAYLEVILPRLQHIPTHQAVQTCVSALHTYAAGDSARADEQATQATQALRELAESDEMTVRATIAERMLSLVEQFPGVRRAEILSDCSDDFPADTIKEVLATLVAFHRIAIEDDVRHGARYWPRADSEPSTPDE